MKDFLAKEWPWLLLLFGGIGLAIMVTADPLAKGRNVQEKCAETSLMTYDGGVARKVYDCSGVDLEGQ